MIRPALRRLRWAMPLALVAILALAQPALAATSEVGKNLGEEIQSFANYLLVGLAVFFGLQAFKERSFALALTIFGITLIFAAMLHAQSDIVRIARALARSIAS